MIGKKKSNLSSNDIEKLISTLLDKKLDKATKNVAKALVAQIKISDLPPGGPITGTEQIEVNKSGVSVSQTTDQLKTFIESDDVSPAFGIIGFKGNATATVIGAINTPVKIAGAYTAGESQAFTHDGSGGAVYTGTQTRKFRIIINTTLSLNLVNAKTTLYIAKNGIIVTTFPKSRDNDDTSPNFRPLLVDDIVELSTNDKIEAFIENNGGPASTGTEPITVLDLTLTVGAPGFTGAVTSSSNNLFAQTNEVPVSNTTLETTLSGTGIGAMSFNADELKVGNQFHFKLGAIFRNTIGAPDITLKLKDGSVEWFNTGAVLTVNTGGNDVGLEMNVTSTVKAIGAAGVARIESVISFLRPGLIFNSGQRVMIKNNTTNFDTTIALNLILTAQWTVADPGNSITSHILSFNRI